MLTQAQVQRYSNDSGLRDIMIAEKEVVLTLLLQLLSERGILDRLAFQRAGPACGKNVRRNQGRFSTDLDFTGIEEHDQRGNYPRHDGSVRAGLSRNPIRHSDDGYYETQDGLSWGVNPTYSHDWNKGGSEIKLQISRRETPTLPTERRSQIEQSYFRSLPFAPGDINCLALPEIIAEKIRACYQRSKAREYL